MPDGGESLVTRDFARLIPRIIDLENTKAPLPEALPLTRSELADHLSYLVAEAVLPQVRFLRDGGHDYLAIDAVPGEPPVRLRLADKHVHPGRNSPIERIAAIARTATREKPLLGLRVAIDPGHFSGIEDMREGKFVTRGKPPEHPESVPADGVTEGDLNVMSARNLAARLKDMGAVAVITRAGEVARTRNRADVNALLDADPELAKKAGNRAVFLTSLDLERRAERMAAVKPDLLITMHFDAEVNQVSADARKEVKIYVPGCFSAGSLASKTGLSRFAQQCGSRSWHASAALATTLVRSICDATGAIPQTPENHGAVDPTVLRPVGKDTGVFARSLRLPHAVPGEPLSVYLEGATYNHPDVFPAAFRDKGRKIGEPGGFVDTYARSVADGLVAFIRSQRRP